MAYFSNGSEGQAFYDECTSCPIEMNECPIHGLQMLMNYDQIGSGLLRSALNELVNDKGECHMKPLILDLEANL